MDQASLDSNHDTGVILQIVVSHTEMGFEAHCLQMDIVTEADTLAQVLEDIADLIRAQYRYARDTNNLESAFLPAPADAFKKLAHATPIGALRSIDLPARSSSVAAGTRR